MHSVAAMFMSQLKGEKIWPVFNCFKFFFKEIVLRHQRGSQTLEFGIKEVGYIRVKVPAP